MQNTHTRAALIRLAQAGLIAALYTVCTVLIQPAAYGTVQFRVSEALTILPVFTPAAIPGLAVGCLVSNLFGLMTGANAAGAWDLLFGSLATLLAAWLTYALRNIRLRGLPFLATWPPVLINAVVVGIEITLVYGVCPGISIFSASPQGNSPPARSAGCCFSPRLSDRGRPGPCLVPRPAAHTHE